MDIIKKLPSVTIHVTVKNAEDTIKKCIDSLLNLNYPNKMILVTEAYSADNTYEILKQYGNRIKLERVRGNAPTAHNHVFKKVNTDFLAMTDADCVVDKNWLNNLVKAFTSEDIIAAGGFCKTPKGVNKLQKSIGDELEERFRHMPKFVSRLPTMNFCVKTAMAKKVMMNQELDVTFETEWGKRLSEFGKIIYVPDAVVYHYHRSTWSSFFKQQFKYAKFVIKTPSVYVKRNQFGDHISKPSMGIQTSLFNLVILSSIFSLLNPSFANVPIVLLISLVLFYFSDILAITKDLSEVFLLFVLYIIRTIAWTLGFIAGITEIILRR